MVPTSHHEAEGEHIDSAYPQKQTNIKPVVLGKESKKEMTLFSQSTKKPDRQYKDGAYLPAGL